MRIDILTVLPDLFPGVLHASILGRAVARGIVDVRVHDLREWTTDRHRTTDDYPFGGGPGMVMKPEPVFGAVREITADRRPRPRVLLTCPQGRPLDQATVQRFASGDDLLIICGRYEGFDERIRTLVDEEVSIGDYVLTGGELAALVITDAVVRLQPGVLGGDESALEESFSEGLLEYPQYTRPASFEGLDVDPVLLSGDHGRIAEWRRRESIRRTAQRRPDLLVRAELSEEERHFAESIIQELE